MAEAFVPEKFVGKPIERVEDEALLRGLARYADDYPARHDTRHAAMLRSPHAHAEIISIDTSEAVAMPGVVAVITGEDVQQYVDPFLNIIKAPMKLWPLAVERVRYVGEALVLVVAMDRYIAEDAVDHIRVEYKILDPAVDPEFAASEGSPVIHEECDSNILSDREFTYGDPDKAFEECDRKVTLKIDFPRSSITPIENYVVMADYHPAEGVYDVLANFQGPFTVHPVMCRALRVKNTGLRLRTPSNTGGGFGIKVAIFPYIVLMAVAARIAGKPVKWVEDRLEHLSSATAAPNRVVEIEAAAMNDGKVTAFRLSQLDDYGAFLRAPMPGPLYRMHGVATGSYEIPNLYVRNRLVMTNKSPSGMVRGFGGPQMYYAIERIMHRVALELNLDPLAVISKNLVSANAFPYHAAAGAVFDSGDYQACVDMAVKEGKLDEILTRRDEARAEGRIYGVGYAAVTEPTHSNMGYITTILTKEERAKRSPTQGTNSNATVSVDPFGGVSVSTDVPPMGQGHATLLAQIVAEQLGLQPAEITCNMEIDTQKDKWSIAAGNYAARFTSGPAVAAQMAAKMMRDKLAHIAAPNLNVPVEEVEFGNHLIFARDNPDNYLKFYRVAGTAHWSPGSLPEGMEGGLSESAVWTPRQLTAPDDKDRINTSLVYGFNFDFCGIEIDRDTGEVRIDHYVTAHDAGTILNPLIAHGQILGSYSHGVSEALYEEFVYDEDGSFKSGTFADYLVPSATEVPEPIILHMETPSPHTPLGAKGLADGNCMSTPVCIANAVCDALDIENVQVPLWPSKISALIHGEEPPSPEQMEVADTEPGKSDSAITGTGSSMVPVDPQTVWDTLLDPVKLATVIPGCHGLDQVAENDYRAEVSLGAGPVRGKFQASVMLSDLDEPKSVTLVGGLDGPLGSSQGEGRVRLEAQDGGTLVSYEYSVEISGKVAAVGSRLLEGGARVVVNQFFSRLVAQTETPGLVAPGSGSPSLLQRLLQWLGVK
ncbi:MAG: molybdopterin-dependent oxidoreductase [Rhodospirillales bacterium]|nr:molybdopterin-dependent oxidoreductase [Rhodospirillales bacterium]